MLASWSTRRVTNADCFPKSKNETTVLQQAHSEEQRKQVSELEKNLQKAETARAEAQARYKARFSIQSAASSSLFCLRCETLEHDHKALLQQYKELQQQYSENVRKSL